MIIPPFLSFAKNASDSSAGIQMHGQQYNLYCFSLFEKMPVPAVPMP